MKITEQKPEPKKPTTVSVSDIPTGTVFRGSIWGPSARIWTAGVFYKAYGPWVPSSGGRFQCVIVRLDSHQKYSTAQGNFANLWAVESTVRNYEPLDVELVIKGVQR